MKKLIAVSAVVAVGLFLTPNLTFAIDAEEVSSELREALRDLPPEEKAAVMEEFRTSVESGEVVLTREGEDVAARAEAVMDESGLGKDVDLSTDEGKGEALREFGEHTDDMLRMGMTADDIKAIEQAISEGRDPGEIFERHFREEGMGEFGEKPDLSTEEGRKEALDRFTEHKDEMLQHGLSEDDLKAIEQSISEGREPSEFMRGEMEGEFGREEFEKMMGGEGRGEVDYREFVREFEHPEMGGHEFERPEFEHGEFERPEFEHGEFERPEFEHGEFERPEFERPEIEREWHGERDESVFQQERDQWLEQHPEPPQP